MTSLTIDNFSGNEAVSEMYEYTCTIKELVDISKYSFNSLESLIGTPVCIKFKIADSKRYFNGIITKCSFADPGVYSITIHPQIWLLTLNNKYHCYGNKELLSFIDVIKKVLNLYTIKYEFDVIDNILLQRKQNWLQAGETDFEFITRIIQKASLYYYFVHTETETKIVFSNKETYPLYRADNAPLRYVWTNEKDVGMEQNDLVKVYSFEHSMIPSKIRSTIIRSEASWEKEPPIKLDLFQTETKALNNKRNETGFHHCKVFQYGVDKSLAEYDVKETEDQIRSSVSHLSGESTSVDLKIGHTFTLSNASYADKFIDTIPIRKELNNKKFVAVNIEHSYSIEHGYMNRFNASTSEGTLIPFTIQNTLQGSILATVCSSPTARSKSANQDYRYLRKSDDFNWDTIKSSGPQIDTVNMIGVYVRFATDTESDEPVWIKLSQQMKSVPEIGAIVLIARANDDSEIPEVQNIIDSYGATTITKPDKWSAMTQVGDNYSVNYGDGKSIRYGKKSPVNLNDDKQMVETRYSTGKYKDVSYNKGASYNYSTSDTGKDGLLSESESYGNTINKSFGDKQESYTEVTTVNNTTKIGSQTNNTEIATTSDTTKIGTQSNDTTITSSTASNKIATQSNTNMIGDSTDISMIGMQISSNTIGAVEGTSITGGSLNLAMTGISNATNITGCSSNQNIVGIDDNVSVAGNSSHLSVTGSSEQISICGNSTNISINGAGISLDVSAAVINCHISGLSITINETLDITM
jgi:type VI secretion system secreted protein VgrG